MPESHERRLKMNLGLRKVLGDELADSVMEHLQPTGLAGVAKSSDIQRLTKRVNQLEKRLDRALLTMMLLITSFIVFGVVVLGALMRMNQILNGF